jgi:diguanylate cyclase (GGDEF)-like protein
MDIDYFKQYNDTYGHQMGDEALKRVAQCLKGTLKRSSDMCFRLGGEEFGVLFMVEKENDALNFSDTIRKNIQNLEIPHKENSAAEHLTVSCGLVCKRGNDISSDDAIYKESDDYLYNAKKTGRNRIYSNLDRR